MPRPGVEYDDVDVGRLVLRGGFRGDHGRPRNVSLPGIGSFVATAIEARDLGAVGWAVLTMFVVILALRPAPVSPGDGLGRSFSLRADRLWHRGRSWSSPSSVADGISRRSAWRSTSGVGAWCGSGLGVRLRSTFHPGRRHASEALLEAPLVGRSRGRCLRALARHVVRRARSPARPKCFTWWPWRAPPCSAWSC